MQASPFSLALGFAASLLNPPPAATRSVVRQAPGGGMQALPELSTVSSAHLRIDAFGYRPPSVKVAILREPVQGYDAPDAYSAPALVQVRRAANGSVVWSGAATAWGGGAVHTTSGDRVWWFDFSALTEVGSFYLFDPTSELRSELFEISDSVFHEVARRGMRMYLHQRCGTAKAVPHVRARWNDTACHLGTQQDSDCRFVLNPQPSTSRDLAGGWHDAGDYNKYINFADDAVHDLLAAYTYSPASWTDDFGLPESGNGVPDLLDELRFELEWFLKMQLAEGSVLHKVSVTDFSAASPPSADGGARRYAPATASATISACGAFAHAARIYSVRPDSSSRIFGGLLRDAAVAAWDWLEAHPGDIPSNYDNQGFVSASAEDSAYHQEVNRLRAAAHLFALTGETSYRDWFDGRYQGAHLFQWGWVSPWEDVAQGALLDYATLPNASPSVAADILAAYEAVVSGPDHLGQITGAGDAYRAFLFDGDHTWGSNRLKSQQGEIFAAMVRLGLDAGNAALYAQAAEDYLHYLHGVNPPGWCYLTNMDEYGAARSVRETYHAWFADGTLWDRADAPWGPPPGYLTGGPNPFYAPAPEYNGPPLEPPQSQPILKSYRDWNTSWPENSWKVTECHIPYQAAYLRLLASHL